MKAWSLRTKSTLLVVGLTTAGIFLASTLHHRFALRALKEEVRTRAAYVATEIAFGITTKAELEDEALLAAQIRSTLAARPTLRWIEVYAADSGRLFRVASNLGASAHSVPDLATQAFTTGHTATAADTAHPDGGWIAAAPIVEGDACLVAPLRGDYVAVLLNADGRRVNIFRLEKDSEIVTDPIFSGDTLVLVTTNGIIVAKATRPK